MRLIIVTGMSGSGKSVALRELEDIGFYCIDNLPFSLVETVADRLRASQKEVAFAVDSRSGLTDSDRPADLVESLRSKGCSVDVLFLTADTQTLLKRFSETRRRHPLSSTKGAETDLTLSEAIEREREILSAFSEVGASCDTSNLSSNGLRNWVARFARTENAGMTIAFESFAFKRGIPYVADLVFDARNLPNPFYDETLRPFTGRDPQIVAFMRGHPQVQEFVDSIAAFIAKWLDSYAGNNRRYFTVAVGCTGGQHRSVYVAQQLYEHFRSLHSSTSVRHRELDAK